MKCKNIFRARIFSPFQGRYRFSGRGVAREVFLIRLLTVLLVAIITLSSCQEEDPPTDTNKIKTGTTTSSEISYRTATITTSASSIAGNKITQHGHVWGTAASPTIENSKTSLGPLTEAKSFSSNMEKLEPATQYFVRSYLSTEYETLYGTSSSFTTLKTGKPVVTTAEPDSITTTFVVCGGETLNDSGLIITEFGFCLDTTEVFSYEDCLSKQSIGEGIAAFNSKIDSLTDGTTYYIKAYAKNEAGIGYGETKTFTTVEITIPVLTTTPVTEITTNSAQSGGNVTSNGNASVTARGIVWSTSPNLTIDNKMGKTNNGTGTGSFTSELTYLDDGTTYHVRAYATNSKGTEYGNEITFTTIDITLPEVTTAEITGITTNSAQSGGEVVSNGNAEVIARGILWNTTGNPTLENYEVKTENRSGTGSFTSNLTSLEDGTEYYVRAYATNSEGTNYGDVQTFSTIEITLPEVTTAAVTNITVNSAQCGGEVISDGNSEVTARGIVWNKTGSPTLDNFEGKTSNGNNIGQFFSDLTDLQYNTEYYVKSYAVNEKGVNYGQEIIFSTKEGFLDIRDGKIYTVVEIGDQKWFAENLAYIPYVSYNESRTIPRYYLGGDKNRYGVLYNFPAAKTACPEGWHLPSDEEWEELCIFISNQNGSFTKMDDDWNNVGEFLKEKTGWHSEGGGNDKYNFSARPGGFYYWSVVPVYDGIGETGIWWSSDYRFIRSLNYESNIFFRKTGSESRGYSVRCIKN